MITNPLTHGYCFLESIQSFLEVADEVIVVNGACDPKTGEIKDDGSVAMIEALPEANRIKIVNHYWNDKDWSWEELGYHLKTGYEACTGNWAFRFDADYIFHPDWVDYLRTYLTLAEDMKIPIMGVTIKKHNLIFADKYFDKSSLPLIVNKGAYPNLNYGLGYDSPDFMCAVDVVEEKSGMPIGWGIEKKTQLLRNCEAQIWCYDFTFMTATQMEEVRRVSYWAQVRYENPNLSQEEKTMDNIKNTAMGKIRKMHISRACRPDLKDLATIEDHPPVMHEKLRGMNKKMLGYELFTWAEASGVKHKCKYL